MNREDADILIDRFFKKTCVEAKERFIDDTLLKLYIDEEKSEYAEEQIDNLLRRLPLNAKQNFCDRVLSKIRRADERRLHVGHIMERVGFFAASVAVAVALFISMPRKEILDSSTEYLQDAYFQEDMLYTLASVVETEEFFDKTRQ